MRANRHMAWCVAAMIALGWVGADGQTYSPFGSDQGGGSGNTVSNSEFVNTEVTTVFRMISDLTGWSIVMSPNLSTNAPKVNLWVKNMTPQQLLDEVGRLGQLVITRDGQTVHVMSFDEYAQIYGLTKKVIPLQHARAVQVSEMVKPYVIKEHQGYIVPNERGNGVILMAPASQMKALEELVAAIDVPQQLEQVQVVWLNYLGADEVALPLEQFLAEAGRGEKDAGLPEYKVQFMVQPGLNAVVIRGDRARIQAAVDLLKQLDIPRQTAVVSYELAYVDAAEMYRVLTDMQTSGPQDPERVRLSGAQRMRVSVSEGGNRIVVEGTEEDHKRVAKIIAAVDKPAPPGTGGIRVYRLENTSAEDVAEVLQELIEEPYTEGGVAAAVRATPISAMTKPPSGGRQPDDKPQPKTPTAVKAPAPAPAPKGSVSITAAPQINAVVIRAPAAEQEAFAEVITQLDRPRDQVMLEMTLVTVSSDDTFRFGIELGAADLRTGTQHIGFTTFGVGQVDSETGNLTIDPTAPFGLNYNLFRTDDYSLVLNALETVGDVRISSAPKVLVEDNTEALISQLSREPYVETSQGETSTITSLGGYVEAGTVLTATPHISQEDWLRLEYEVELSSFRARTAQQIAANIPPPQRQSVTSGTVRIPDDCMVVLGGLIDTRDDEVIDRVPILGRIPVLGSLFRNVERGKQYQTLFVFIRPVVLRDPEFADLISLSRQDRTRAGVGDEHLPRNPPQLLEGEPPAPVQPATMESPNG